MSRFRARVFAGLATLLIASCAARDECPTYPNSYSHSAREGPWAAQLSPLVSAFDARDQPEVARLLAILEPEIRATYGENSVAYAEIEAIRAIQLYRDDQVEASIPHFRLSLSHYRAALGPNHRDVALALHTLADVITLGPETGVDAAVEAEALYRGAYVIRRASLGASDIETISAADAAYRAMIVQIESGSPIAITRQDADAFMSSALDAASIALQGADQRQRLLEALVDFAEEQARLGNHLIASNRYNEARRLLFELPRSCWSLKYSVYPGLIAALRSQGRNGAAQLVELEYNLIGVTGWLY